MAEQRDQTAGPSALMLDLIGDKLGMPEGSRSLTAVLAAVDELKAERNAVMADEQAQLDELLEGIDSERERYVTSTDALSEGGEALTRAIDAVELMVEQYLHGQDGEHDHDFMSAGEHASDVLAELRPDEWELTATGVRRIKESESRAERGEARVKAFDELHATYIGAYLAMTKVLELLRDWSSEEDYQQARRDLVDTLDALRFTESLKRGVDQAARGEVTSLGSFTKLVAEEGDDGD